MYNASACQLCSGFLFGVSSLYCVVSECVLCDCVAACVCVRVVLLVFRVAHYLASACCISAIDSVTSPLCAIRFTTIFEHRLIGYYQWVGNFGTKDKVENMCHNHKKRKGNKNLISIWQIFLVQEVRSPLWTFSALPVGPLIIPVLDFPVTWVDFLHLNVFHF